jgi:peptidoglycan/xylan/chitin deacetylase (PgdA/CDA1 family)
MPDRVQRILPVLTYHSIDPSGSVISIAPDEFRRHMQRLSQAGWRTLRLREAMDGLSRGAWPSRSLVLTFDDGYTSVIEFAMGELAVHGFTAIVFAVSGSVGRTNRWPGQPSWVPDLPLLDWPALRSLVESGWELGAHSRTHARLPSLAADEVAREMRESKQELQDRCGAEVNAFAYPYGVTSPTVVQTAASHFTAAFGTRLAYVSPHSHPFELERLDAYYLRSGRLLEDLDSIRARSYFAIRRAVRRWRPARK